MDNFNKQQQAEIDKRINKEITDRLRVEEDLQNQIKWLKIELKESQLRERVINLEINLRILLVIGLSVLTIYTILN